MDTLSIRLLLHLAPFPPVSSPAEEKLPELRFLLVSEGLAHFLTSFSMAIVIFQGVLYSSLYTSSGNL